ncbi:uncharacterized protein LOC106013906 [Aplysia californica]|uniref:Uncharacterized protein LOC106013906 n=1 Tax=Aplysia californica TaxID=6500 RepID=A0ABM1AEM3_APLCA|nr:uncharacterized protein LOC106013906 [Aplysia californica]
MNAAVQATDVYDGFERGEETLIVALDLDDVYNRIEYDVLLRTMINLKIIPQLVVWVGEALLKRRVAMWLGNWTCDTRSITPESLQGSPLSPVLFNIYTVGKTSGQLESLGRELSFADVVLVYRQTG